MLLARSATRSTASSPRARATTRCCCARAPCEQLAAALHRRAERLHLRRTCVSSDVTLFALSMRLIMSSRLVAPRIDLERRVLSPSCTASTRRCAIVLLARLQVAASRCAARGGSRAGRAGSARAVTSRRSTAGSRALERVGELLQLRHDLLRLGPLRRHRGVGKRRDCRQKSDADPRENVRRLSQPTNDNPRIGDGTGAPGGAGTSRGGG